MDSTITELDLDQASQQFVHELRGDGINVENDLSVDGLSDSLMSRLFSFFTLRGN